MVLALLAVTVHLNGVTVNKCDVVVVQYSSAIQAEVTELYARLEVDNWDVPQHSDQLASKSYASLGSDSKSNNGRLKSLQASEDQSSLITLLHLNVDVDFEATADVNIQNNCIYQLVDTNLLSSGSH